jgi:hypothetical protein
MIESRIRSTASVSRMLSYWPEHQARLERCRLLMRNIDDEEEMDEGTIVCSLI